MTEVPDRLPSGEHNQQCETCGKVVSVIASFCSGCGRSLRGGRR